TVEVEAVQREDWLTSTGDQVLIEDRVGGHAIVPKVATGHRIGEHVRIKGQRPRSVRPVLAGVGRRREGAALSIEHWPRETLSGGGVRERGEIGACRYEIDVAELGQAEATHLIARRRDPEVTGPDHAGHGRPDEPETCDVVVDVLLQEAGGRP